MKYIFVLKHIYEFDDSNGYKQFEDKFLGIYSSEKKAKDAIERYFVLSGFNQYPKDCFVVEKWKVNEDTTWKEGFVKSFEANGIRKMAEIYDESMDGLDVSSWLMGKSPFDGESAEEFAIRMMNEKFGEGNWNLGEGLKEEYNELILWGRLCFE